MPFQFEAIRLGSHADYTQDYDEKYPYALTAVPTDANTPAGVWFTNIWAWQQTLYPYTRSMQIAVCPSGYGTQTAKPYQGHYGANLQLLPYGHNAPVPAPVSLAQIAATANTYMFMDAACTAWRPDKPSPPPPPATNICRELAISTTVCNAADSFYDSDCQSGRHFGGVNMPALPTVAPNGSKPIR